MGFRLVAVRLVVLMTLFLVSRLSAGSLVERNELLIQINSLSQHEAKIDLFEFNNTKTIIPSDVSILVENYINSLPCSYE